MFEILTLSEGAKGPAFNVVATYRAVGTGGPEGAANTFIRENEIKDGERFLVRFSAGGGITEFVARKTCRAERVMWAVA